MDSVREVPRIDAVTVVGLALLALPVLTMFHEIGGHAGTCLLTGHRVTEIGAFYVECDAPAGTLAGRLVAAGGPGIDLLGALAGFALWKRATGDLARLVLWYVWTSCGFTAAGYLAYSGVTGIGDLNPGAGSGIGPLPAAGVLRIVFALAGAFIYWRLIVLGMRTLAGMIGQGDGTKRPRRIAAHLFYIVLCSAAVVASLPNPVGLFITLASATAASFGGHAGLISIGFATRPGEPKMFVVERRWAILVVGALATLAFTIVLGPTIRF